MPASTSRRGRCWWPWARPPSQTRACRSGSRVSWRVAELVVAFDVASAREALGLADRLPGLGWAKLGPVLFVREGPALVREFVARGIRVFLDLKWHDIPSVVAGAVEAAQSQGVAMATVHALAGPTVLAAARKAAGEGAMALVAATVLTSHAAGDFEAVVGRGVPDLGIE